MKIPRGDINGVGEDEVTVTSGLHAQPERTNKPTEESGLPYIVTSGLHAPAERTNRQTEERGQLPVEASTKIQITEVSYSNKHHHKPKSVDVAHSRGKAGVGMSQ